MSSPQSELVSVDTLLAQILVDTNDENLSNGFTRGWYISRMQEGLEEFSIDTLFSTQTHEILNWYNGVLEVDYPSGCISIKQIHLFNGDCCTIDNSVEVVWKKIYNTSGKTSGHTSRIKESGTNQNSIYQDFFKHTSVYYATLHDNVISLSPDCQSYDNIQIIYAGVKTGYGSSPIIPVFLRKFLRDYVVERYYFAAMARDRSLSYMWEVADLKLNGNGRHKKGSLKEAKLHISTMQPFERDHYLTYRNTPDV